jgi:hypothetical protein
LFLSPFPPFHLLIMANSLCFGFLTISSYMRNHIHEYFLINRIICVPTERRLLALTCVLDHLLGLASCSSLKELYLAGNKISEVDGLHRLLKLKILDLRHNKISTSKGLGQLAANYNSLEAINLAGNPAQKNVGDEHLKKYLLGLLPNLAVYNKQPIRATGSKDVSDRHTRKISSSHHSDRGGRPDRRSSRLVGAPSAHKPQSSRHGRSGYASSSALKYTRARNTHRTSLGSRPLEHASAIDLAKQTQTEGRTQ